MSLSPSSLSAQDIRTNYTTAIKMLAFPPVPGLPLTTPEPPGKLFGFYDSTVDSVILYVVDQNGTRMLRV